MLGGPGAAMEAPAGAYGNRLQGGSTVSTESHGRVRDTSASAQPSACPSWCAGHAADARDDAPCRSHAASGIVLELPPGASQPRITGLPLFRAGSASVAEAGQVGRALVQLAAAAREPYRDRTTGERRRAGTPTPDAPSSSSPCPAWCVEQDAEGAHRGPAWHLLLADHRMDVRPVASHGAGRVTVELDVADARGRSGRDNAEEGPLRVGLSIDELGNVIDLLTRTYDEAAALAQADDATPPPRGEPYATGAERYACPAWCGQADEPAEVHDDKRHEGYPYAVPLVDRRTLYVAPVAPLGSAPGDAGRVLIAVDDDDLGQLDAGHARSAAAALIRVADVAEGLAPAQGAENALGRDRRFGEEAAVVSAGAHPLISVTTGRGNSMWSRKAPAELHDWQGVTGSRRP
jgi:hypothetical protein